MFQSGLPHTYWGDALFQAAFVLNRLLFVVLSWKSPYECLFNQKPDYEQIKIFGYLCYASNLNPAKTKLDSRVFKYVLLGNSTSNKGYKLLNLDTSTTFVSRDV